MRIMFKKNDTIVFYGDSITSSSKTNPEGSLTWDGLGSGYVNMINTYYLLYKPELNLRIINQGISGNRTEDLIKRLDSDVLSYNPNYVFIMIGVNDAWRMFDCPQIPEFKISNEKYRNNLLYLVKKIIASGSKVVLMSPFYLETNLSNPLRNKIDQYVAIMEEIAAEYNLLFINLQKSFDELLEKVLVFSLSADRVHLNMAGNMYLRDEILRFLTAKNK
jgi:lysophospholipase L1-like esterase